MKRTNLCIMVLVCVLMLGMVVGCDTPAGGETDTWTAVSSLDQVNGTWKGSYSQNMTVKEAFEMSGETWTSEMQAVVGDVRVTVSADMLSTINSSAKTQEASVTMTQTYSGGNIAVFWPLISAGLSGQPGVVIDNTKHSVTMTENMPARQISDEEIAELLNSGLQINQNGTKLNMPANAMGQGSPALIYTKQ